MPPQDLLERARDARERGALDEAARWLAEARAAASRPGVYPDVHTALETEAVLQLVATGRPAEARDAIRDAVTRLRKIPMNELPLPLLSIELALAIRGEGEAAAVAAFDRWERRTRHDFGAGSGSHDAVMDAGAAAFEAELGVEPRRALVGRVIERLERAGQPVSPKLRALAG